MALAILACSATEHLNGFLSRVLHNYIMMTWTCYMPEAETMGIAHGESEHTSAMLEGERPTGRASALVLAKSVYH